MAIHPSYIYTFGQPRVGDDEFVAHYNSVVGSDKTIRVTHKRDPVPLVPWTTWGFNYLHTPHEVYYPDDPDGAYIICDGSGEDDNCINQHYWWEVLTNVFIIADHLNYLDVGFFGAVLACNVDIGGYNSNGTTDDTGSIEAYNGTGLYILNTYEYIGDLDIVIDWSEYDSVMYTSEDIKDSIGLQTLINYALREAAVRARNDLKDDTDIHCSINNITKIDNSTTLLNMQVSFENSTQFTGFYCDINIILDYFNENMKSALSLDDVSVPLIYHYYDAIDTSNCDTTMMPVGSLATTGDGDSQGEDDPDADGSELFGTTFGSIELIIVLIGVFVLIVLIVSGCYYKKNKYGSSSSGKNDNERNNRNTNDELSNKDSLQQKNVRMSPVYVSTNPDI